MNALETALATRLADATLTALAPGGVWQDVAPIATTTPHVVFALMSGVDDAELAGATAFEDCRYLVKAVAETKAGADTAAARIHVLLQNGSFAITGYTLAGCTREERITFVEADGQRRWYHSGGVYRLMACPT